MKTLSAMNGAKGTRYSSLRKKASKQRKEMIRPKRANRAHEEDGLPDPEYDEQKIREGMSSEYAQLLEEVKAKPEGRKALEKYRRFWQIPFPTEIQQIDGPKEDVVLIGAGRTTGIFLADGQDKQNTSRVWDIKQKGPIAFDTDGRRIFILNPKADQSKFGKDLEFVGFARETHYIPTDDMENAGSFKTGKYWVHEHDDEGGKFPEVYKDAAGNYIYAPGTMRIDEWLRS